MAFSPRGRPCFSCLYPAIPPPESIETCETAGIVVPIARGIPALQMTFFMRVLLKQISFGRCTFLDLWENVLNSFTVSTKEDCPVCVKGNRPHLLGRRLHGEIMCGRDSVLVIPSSEKHLDLNKFSSGFSKNKIIRISPWFVEIKVNPKISAKFFPDGRAVFSGISDVERSIDFYSRLTGF